MVVPVVVVWRICVGVGGGVVVVGGVGDVVDVICAGVACVIVVV